MAPRLYHPKRYSRFARGMALLGVRVQRILLSVKHDSIDNEMAASNYEIIYTISVKPSLLNKALSLTR